MKFFCAGLSRGTARGAFVFLLVHSVALAAQTAPPLAVAAKAVDLLLNEKYGELHAMFEERLASELTEEKLRGMGPTMRSLGQLHEVAPAKLLQTPKGSDVLFELKSATAVLGLVVSVDPEGRVSGFTARKADIGTAAPAEWTNPPYSRLDSFDARKITVGGGQWALPGTLLVPRGKGPFAAVVMVHGSPPYDRDEAVESNKPFRDLAEGLASKGIAVLRFENRPRAYADRMASIRDLTIQQEIVDDVVFAVAAARSQPEIDGKRVFVLAHNAAAYVAPRIAAADRNLAGLILLAANLTPLDELVVLQASNAGVPPEQMKQIRDEAAKVKAIAGPAANGQAILGEPVSYWVDLRSYNPAQEAKKLSCRLLFLQGSRDFQVPARELAMWRAALGAKPGTTFREYPALNHYFIAGEGKSSLAEYKKPGHVAAEVVSDIALWIGKR